MILLPPLSLLLVLVGLIGNPLFCQALLFDPGEPPTPKPLHSSSSSTCSNLLPSSQPPPLERSLIYPSTKQVSLPLGCKRSSELLDHVCNNPYSSSIHSDLLICDLTSPDPLIKPEQPSTHAEKRHFAISGTITVEQGAQYDSAPNAQPNRIDGQAPPSDQQPRPEIPQQSQRSDYPGPNDEGFWRQRNGKYEWHPSQPDLWLAPSHHDPDRTTSVPSAPNAPSSQDPAHIRAYDAWSAEHGEGETFLSFSEWKERYADAIKDKEEAERVKAKAKKLKNNNKEQHLIPTNAATAPLQLSSLDSSQLLDSRPTAYQPAVPGKLEAAITTNTLQSKAHEHSDPVIGDLSSTKFGNASIQQANEQQLLHEQPQQAPQQPLQEQQQQQQQSDSHLEHDQETNDPTSQTEQVSISRIVPASNAAASQLAALKHRWNFASTDCAAVVHRTNPSAKFANAILSGKKDRYMLSPCPKAGGSNSQGHFVIVELCDAIKIDTIVLANYEFFSSMFKKFTVRTSKFLKAREEDWNELGTFRARNIRGLQVFSIPPSKASQDFSRYVKIDFLEHYGSEYFCPVSLLRVYGLTQLEDYEEEEMKQSSDSYDVDEKEIEIEETLQLQDQSMDSPPATSNAKDSAGHQPTLEKLVVTDEDVWQKHEQIFRQRIEKETVKDELSFDSTALGIEDAAPKMEQNPANKKVPDSTKDKPVSDAVKPSPPDTKPASPDMPRVQVQPIRTSLEVAYCPNWAFPRQFWQANMVCLNSGAETWIIRTNSHKRPALPTSATKAIKLRQDQQHSNRDKVHDHETTSVGERNPNPATGVASIRSSEESNQPSNKGSDNFARPPMQRNGAPHAQPSGSESIYRAIARRLSALESNATLSMSYIEHSGHMLREVFSRMERRQEERMSEMLRALNSSNWHQIEALKRRQQVDLQRAIFEFDVHRQQAEAERVALMNEVHLLAKEVLLEKRLGIAQLALLLAVFIFLGLTRGSRTAPFLHSRIAKFGKGSRLRLRVGKMMPPESKEDPSHTPKESTIHSNTPNESLINPMSPKKQPQNFGQRSGHTFFQLPLPKDRRSSISTVGNAAQKSIDGVQPMTKGQSTSSAWDKSSYPSNWLSHRKSTRRRASSRRLVRIQNSSSGRMGRFQLNKIQAAQDELKQRLQLLTETLDTAGIPGTLQQQMLSRRATKNNHSQKPSNADSTQALLSNNGQATTSARMNSETDSFSMSLSQQPTSGRKSQSEHQRQLPDERQLVWPQTRSSRTSLPAADDIDPLEIHRGKTARYMTFSDQAFESGSRRRIPSPSRPSFGIDHGLSSDWTERSEDQSENGTLLSDNDEDEQQRRPNNMDQEFTKDQNRSNGSGNIATSDPSRPLAASQPRRSVDQANQQDRGSPRSTFMSLQRRKDSNNRRLADPNLASDSDSEGGTWQRVLPRRSASSSITRRSKKQLSSFSDRESKSSFPSSLNTVSPISSFTAASSCTKWNQHSSPRILSDSAAAHRSSFKPNNNTTPDSFTNNGNGKRVWQRNTFSSSSSISTDLHDRSGTPDTIRAKLR